jgi:hypothetical protein
MRFCILLTTIMVFCLSTHSQKMDTIINVVSFPQEMNIAYSQLYVLNSDIGDITFFDQGHPDKRQYILNANIIPNFYITPRKWRFNVVLTPNVRVRIIAAEKESGKYQQNITKIIALLLQNNAVLCRNKKSRIPI